MGEWPRGWVGEETGEGIDRLEDSCHLPMGDGLGDEQVRQVKEWKVGQVRKQMRDWTGEWGTGEWMDRRERRRRNR